MKTINKLKLTISTLLFATILPLTGFAWDRDISCSQLSGQWDGTLAVVGEVAGSTCNTNCISTVRYQFTPTSNHHIFDLEVWLSGQVGTHQPGHTSGTAFCFGGTFTYTIDGQPETHRMIGFTENSIDDVENDNYEINDPAEIILRLHKTS